MDAKWKIRLIFAAIVVGVFILAHFGVIPALFADPINSPAPL
ncbi:MAG: hypothetical protein QW260_07350 [Thermoproteota archaeon]